MSSTVFWGLTNTDIQNCFSNDLGAAKVFFAGAAVAGVATVLALKFLNQKGTSQASFTNPIISLCVGTIAGSCASAYVAYHSVTIAANQALKFLVLTSAAAVLGSIPVKGGAVIGLFTFGGGVWPVLGRTPLYCIGFCGSMFGATCVIGY